MEEKMTNLKPQCECDNTELPKLKISAAMKKIVDEGFPCEDELVKRHRLEREDYETFGVMPETSIWGDGFWIGIIMGMLGMVATALVAIHVFSVKTYCPYGNPTAFTPASSPGVNNIKLK